MGQWQPPWRAVIVHALREGDREYVVCKPSKSDLYEALEPAINAGRVELLDSAVLQEQLLTLVIRGARIDHQPGDHDDHANVAAGAIWACISRPQSRPNISIYDEALGRYVNSDPETDARWAAKAGQAPRTSGGAQVRDLGIVTDDWLRNG